MTRDPLPNARGALTFDFEARGVFYTASVGVYPDGRIGELFLNGLKRDTDSDIVARDLAILISFALQHGATLADLAKAMTRDGEGRPQGLAGHALDQAISLNRDA